jgi:hypothetical protein
VFLFIIILIPLFIIFLITILQMNGSIKLFVPFIFFFKFIKIFFLSFITINKNLELIFHLNNGWINIFKLYPTHWVTYLIHQQNYHNQNFIHNLRYVTVVNFIILNYSNKMKYFFSYFSSQFLFLFNTIWYYSVHQLEEYISHS